MAIPQLTTGAFYCFGLRTRVSLRDPMQVAGGIYASTEPPFFIDEWWQKQLGELQVKQIHGCSLFLLALTEDPAYESFLSSRLQSHYLSLLLQGVGYSAGGVILAGQNSPQGLRVSSIGTHETYVEPYKVISHSVTAARLALTHELAKGIDCIFADTSKYLRLRKGFNAFLDGIRQNQLHTRLHSFIRAIEAVIKPKQGEGTRKFTYRCQFFGGQKPEDVSLLNELYELRSAAEHMNPMNDKLSAYPAHERDNVKGLRTLQAELLASFIYRKVLTSNQLLPHFVNDQAIDAFWANDTRRLIAAWGNDTADLHSAKGHLQYPPVEGRFLDFLT
ncbi:MAG: hypothetical protein ACREBG_30655 [Pyrinomonadaceae bacterium]